MQILPTVGRVCSHNLVFCLEPIGNTFIFSFFFFSDLAASAHFQGGSYSAMTTAFFDKILFPAGGTWLVID